MLAVNLLADGAKKHARQPASDQWADHWHDRIAPVRCPFTSNGEYCMGRARSKVASGIDRVTGSSSERKADAPNQSSDQVGAETGRRSRGGNSLRKDGTDHKNQNESAEDLADQVCAKSADRRRGAETGEFQALVRGFLPVWQEVKPDKSGSYESACHLRNQVRGELRKLARGHSKAHRHR